MTTPPARVLVLDRTRELAARIRHNAVGPGAVVEGCPDLARAESRLTAADCDVIVAGRSLMHRAGLRGLASLHTRYPWVAVVLALHERPRADLAEIVRVGADDLVPLHADDAGAAPLAAPGGPPHPAPPRDGRGAPWRRPDPSGGVGVRRLR